MDALVAIRATTLPAMLQEAAARLEQATTAAEVLEARDLAEVAYVAAKTATRLAVAQHAHADVVRAAHRAQADALEIEGHAMLRLTEEYKAAQTREEVRHQGERGGGEKNIPDENVFLPPTVGDIGLTSKEIFEGDQLRRAEAAEQGFMHRVLTGCVATGQAPTKATLRRAVKEVLNPDPDPPANPPPPPPPKNGALSLHDASMIASGIRQLMRDRPKAAAKTLVKTLEPRERDKLKPDALRKYAAYFIELAEALEARGGL